MRALVLVLLSPAAPLRPPTRSSFVNEGVIPAPIDEVWKVFSTSEGYKALGPALAEVDLRVGGLIRSRYRADGVLGDAETIENVIVDYRAPVMMAMRIHEDAGVVPVQGSVEEHVDGHHVDADRRAARTARRRATATAPTKSRSRCAASSRQAINKPSRHCAGTSARPRSNPTSFSLLLHNHNDKETSCPRTLRSQFRSACSPSSRPGCSSPSTPWSRAHMQVWQAFIAWGCHYHCGGKIAGTRTTIVCMSFGAVVGMTAGDARAAALRPLGEFAAPVAVGLGAAVICLASKVPLLGTIPASVYGFASIAGLFLLTAALSRRRALWCRRFCRSSSARPSRYVSKPSPGALTRSSDRAGAPFR